MDGKPPTGWRRFLRYRMAYNRIIPPETRVDPALFPENSFPVVCPKCDYLLRGLPDGRCPECGREFERGRLLVEQYVIEQGKRCCRRTIRWVWRTGVAGWALLLAPPLIASVLSWVYNANPNLYPIDALPLMRVAMVISVLAALMMLVSLGLTVRWAVTSRRKCKRVFEAIDQTQPSMSNAQRHKWVLWVVWLVGLGGVFTWEWVSESPGLFKHYSRHPSHLLLTIAVAFGIGIILFIVNRLLVRLRR